MSDSAASPASPPLDVFNFPSNLPQGSAPIQLYSPGTPTGQEISIMLNELTLPYDAHVVDNTNNVQFNEWRKSANLNLNIPAIVDKKGPEGKPIVVFESAAILIYLAEKTGEFLPRHGSARYSVLQWLTWQTEGVGQHFFIDASEQVPHGEKRCLMQSKGLLSVLNKQLALHQYCAGPDYSIADMAIYPWVKHIFKVRGERLESSEYPHVQRWMEILADRPAIHMGAQ